MSEQSFESVPIVVDTAIGPAGGFYVAPAGTPLPANVDALEGFQPVGYITRDETAIERARAFAESTAGQPYVWPRRNGKNSIFVRVGEYLDVFAEGLRPVMKSFTATFSVLAGNVDAWTTLFGEWPDERSSRSARRRRNRLRRKRIARKRRRG